MLYPGQRCLLKLAGRQNVCRRRFFVECNCNRRHMEVLTKGWPFPMIAGCARTRIDNSKHNVMLIFYRDGSLLRRCCMRQCHLAQIYSLRILRWSSNHWRCWLCKAAMRGDFDNLTHDSSRRCTNVYCSGIGTLCHSFIATHGAPAKHIYR